MRGSGLSSLTRASKLISPPSVPRRRRLRFPLHRRVFPAERTVHVPPADIQGPLSLISAMIHQ